MTTLKNFINGESVDSASGETMAIVDPSTGEKYGTAPVSNEADIDKAYAAASAAFAEWKKFDLIPDSPVLGRNLRQRREGPECQASSGGKIAGEA